jgi:hypothetical protein
MECNIQSPPFAISFWETLSQTTSACMMTSLPMDNLVEPPLPWAKSGMLLSVVMEKCENVGIGAEELHQAAVGLKLLD